MAQPTIGVLTLEIVVEHARSLKDKRSVVKSLKDRLTVLATNPFEKRSFLYLDIISWLESKIEGKPVQAVIRRKFLHHEPRF